MTAMQNNLFGVKRMRRFNFLNLFFVALTIIFSFSAIIAQDEISPDNQNRRVDRERRPNLLAELGLTQVQRGQIRNINLQKRPLVRDAQQRLHEANRKLDQAIYADNMNETDIQARLKDVQTAQSELIKIRFTNELAIRRILTVEQLSKFRALREQFAQQMENNQDPQQRRMQNIRRGFKLRRNQMRPNN
jgi:Spy/CpxP family protein refolding chaperone